MRLSRRPEPFDSDDYIFELKIDGFRSLAYIENGQCDLVSRNGNMLRNFKDQTEGTPAPSLSPILASS
jgi:ATP-dependent DNA ligase